MPERTKILFLAANPIDTDQLRLDREIREIQSRIRAGDFREHFDLVSRWAVRPDDLLQAFNEVRPDIVHFSGHGTDVSEIVIENDQGESVPISRSALTSLFKNLRGNIRLVVLNACHSETQASAISQQIDCTIGMNQSIGDEAAIVFSSWVYGALAFGRSVGEAFEQGRTALMLRDIPEESTPVLLPRNSVDPLAIVFAGRNPANKIVPPLSYELLECATFNNSAINVVRDDQGISVVTGSQQFHCDGDREKAAQIEHAVSALLNAGWLRHESDDLYFVTQAGFDVFHQKASIEQIDFRMIRDQMPDLIAEMKADLEGEDNKFVREFFVMSKNHVLGGSRKPRFIYYFEDHDNLSGKMDVLENHGFLIDVTPGNTPIYRMTEEFVSLVRKYG